MPALGTPTKRDMTVAPDEVVQRVAEDLAYQECGEDHEDIDVWFASLSLDEQAKWLDRAEVAVSGVLEWLAEQFSFGPRVPPDAPADQAQQERSAA